jgi:predicted RNase H-like HicB family nuclease/DNA-binding XRE family transcriptional regulator
MKLAYPIRFHVAEEGGFWAQGVDPLENVMTQGESIGETREMARDALTLVLGFMLDNGQPIPRPPRVEGDDIHWIEPAPEVLTPMLLKWAREEAQLTQGELASRMGVTQQSYQRLERSGANPSIKTLAKVARALGQQLHIDLIRA